MTHLKANKGVKHLHKLLWTSRLSFLNLVVLKGEKKNRKKENGEKKVGKWKGYENGKKERNRLVRKWN